jgi:hypothetical protein
MFDLILQDSLSNPGVFWWRGSPLSLDAIREWEAQGSLTVPEDLRQLWSLKGGADFFESETILQPFGGEEYDRIIPASTVRWERGLDKNFCVLTTGCFETVFRKSDGAIFALDSDTVISTKQFRDLDEWYRNAVRPQFADKYGLTQWRQDEVFGKTSDSITNLPQPSGGADPRFVRRGLG